MKGKVIFLVLATLLSISSMNVSNANEVSLKQKIGQMLILGFKGSKLQPNNPIVKAILAQQVGGVILFDYDYKNKKFDHNIQNPQQLSQLTKQLQGYATQAAINQKNDLKPLFISIDYEGGEVNRLKEDYGFPKTLPAAIISKMKPEQAQLYANQMAKTLRQEGINMNYAPVLDVAVNPQNPIISKLGRSFSSDPKVVVNYATIFSKAYQNNGIVCVYKHFPGHGSSTGDTHAGFVDVTKTWKIYELEPYYQLLHKPYSCPMVMTAHVVNERLDKQGYPASISYAITTDLLRKKMKFNGIVVTDDMDMKAITDNYNFPNAIRLAINAGADILVIGNQLVSAPKDPGKIVDMIYGDVMSGKIPKSRIDESYERILKIKSTLQKV